ncbi:hypothetical protein PO909_003681, partial [Leuciscus waleckii]
SNVSHILWCANIKQTYTETSYTLATITLHSPLSDTIVPTLSHTHKCARGVGLNASHTHKCIREVGLDTSHTHKCIREVGLNANLTLKCIQGVGLNA